MTLNDVSRLLGVSLLMPRVGVRLLLELQVPHVATWLGLGLMSVLLTLIGAAGFYLSPEGLAPNEAVNYVGFVVVHAILLALPAGLIYIVGERTGSLAPFMDALLLMVWLQVMLLPLTLISTIAVAVSEPAGQLFMVLSGVATLWFLTNFVTELHRYRSRRNVFLGIIAASVVLGVLMLPLLDPRFA
jgi:hypothetical protein